LKLILKQKLHTVHHNFHWLLVAAELAP